MSRRKGRRGLGVDPTGRSKHNRFIKLDHGLLNSDAWHHLSPHAFKLLIAIWARHNGQNNGQISFSRREAMGVLKCGEHRASECFDELQKKGFLRCARGSGFNVKSREARLWALTAEPVGDDPPGRDFKHWQPEKQNTGVERAPHRCRDDTRGGDEATIVPFRKCRAGTREAG